MAEHIDLGSDLAAFSDGPGDDDTAGYPGEYSAPHWLGSGTGGRRIPLAQLQAEGFNTTPPPWFDGPRPPYPGPRAVADFQQHLQKLLTWPEPVLPPITFNAQTWLPGDDAANSDQPGADDE